ncbi:MAG: dehydrogenase, partial [Oligoflexia bacterium]|nr:dehydrogenase [Oligoflexia bacterium]
LVGDSKEGKIQRLDGPYHAAEAVRHIANVLRVWKGPTPVPGHVRSSIPLIPVDICAQAIVDLTLKGLQESWVGFKSLHLSPSKGLTARGLYASIFKKFGLNSEILLMPLVPDFLVKEAFDRVINLPGEELEYLLNLPHLDTSETRAILGDGWCPEFHAYEESFWKGYDEYISHR